jgi:trans-aconitate methyltransferase
MSQNASSQEWNATRYAANARFVSDLGQPVLDLLKAQAGERMLDLGCGDGALTEKVVVAGARVVGVDSSADMIDAARKRGLDARVMDAYHLTFDREFDAVF